MILLHKVTLDPWRSQRDAALIMLLTLQVKMLLPRRKLKPRTFRAGVGQTVFVGGVLRVDVQSSPGVTLYVTVWASDELICPVGKTDKADERCAQLNE